MRQDDFDARRHEPRAQQGLTLQELLASDMTRAVLRADGLEMRCFEATLRAAAERLRAARRQREAIAIED